MPVSVLGLYERAVQAGLSALRPKPWSPPDLVKVRRVIDDELLCRLGMRGCAAEVTDWLAGMDAEDRAELIERLNHYSAMSET